MVSGPTRWWLRLCNTRPVTRVQQVGSLSLSALIFGGIILIFVGGNGLNFVRTAREGKIAEGEGSMKSRFRVGSDFSVQAWLAITGIGFGMLSYGFLESYYHLFDRWCSRQASQDSGLDYGRYLNTLPRSPVLYGLRGYRWFLTLRYTLIWGTVALSIAYKFGIIVVRTYSYQNLDDGVFGLMPVRLRGLSHGLPSPWFIDSPLGYDNECFFHQLSDEAPRIPDDGDAFIYEEHWQEEAFSYVPAGIVMVAQMTGSGPSVQDLYQDGTIFTREVVMVANMTVEEGDFEMTRDDDGWFRVETAGTKWYNDTNERAVVEYRTGDPGKLQIQWAPVGDWLNGSDSTVSVAVTSRVTFSMKHAVAEVSRQVLDERFAKLEDTYDNSQNLRVLSVDKDTITPAYPDARLQDTEHWIGAILSDKNSTLAEGISAIVRATMAGWTFDTENLRFVDEGEFPFGEEEEALSVRIRDYPWLRYPFYTGSLKNSTGCYLSAAVLFVVVGFTAIIIASLRLWAGPADLTSWAGQHIYLAQVGAITLKENRHVLASGFMAAPMDLGTLRLYGRHRPGEAYIYGTAAQNDKHRDSMADDSTIHLCEIQPTHSSPKV